MNFEAYVNYFEDCAKSNRTIKHASAKGYNAFAMMDIEEIVTNTSANFNGTALILENPEYRDEDLLSDNHRELISGAFLIVREYTRGDFKNRIAVRDECLTVCRQIQAKLKNDYMHRKHDRSYKYNINGIDMGSFRKNPVSGLFNGFWVGWRVSFTMNQTTPLTLNEADWFDEKLFKI
jgi:hypothetical protein